MKNLLLIFSVLLMVGCASSYTDKTFFNCPETGTYHKNTDKKELIYQILKRAVVDEKDIPDYSLIKDKQKIYINNVYHNAPWGVEPKEIFSLDTSEIPPEIGGIVFCLKSREELQAIANKTSDFLFLSFQNIEVKDDTATIGIDNGWMGQYNDNKVHLSGGGYIWQFKKINGEWVFDKIISRFQS